MSPLGNAVGFIHHYERDALKRPQFFPESLILQSLRTHIKESAPAVKQSLPHSRCLAIRHAGVHESGLYAMGLEIIHLIFHESHERGYHKRESAKSEARHLKRDRLSSSCGHEAECVVAREHRLYDFALPGAERVITPVALKDGQDVLHLSDQ